MTIVKAGTTNPNAVEVITTGFTESTTENYLLDAGALYYDLEYDSTTKKFKGVPFAATVGGIKIKIGVKLRQPKVDGLLVDVEGNDVIESSEGSIECTAKEFKDTVIEASLHADEDTTETVEGYKKFKGRNKITDKDYRKVGFVGKVSGYDTPLIVIFHKAINTAGFDIDTKDKDEAGIPFKFEARADKTKPTDYQGWYEIYAPVKVVTP